MTCTHSVDTSAWVASTDDWSGEDTSGWVYRSRCTWEDAGIGAFRCTQCGEVGFYTGSWRAFYERGTACSGSDRVSPGELRQVRDAMSDFAAKNSAPKYPLPPE